MLLDIYSMTAENFSYFLKNPEYLYQLSYQELKSLVVQYPYCQNLRYLLVTKSQIDNSIEYQKDLELAATYHVDRSYLYQLIQQREQVKPTENFVLKEDYLELKEISTTEVETDENINLAPIQNDDPSDKLEALELPVLKKVQDNPLTAATTELEENIVEELNNNLFVLKQEEEEHLESEESPKSNVEEDNQVSQEFDLSLDNGEEESHEEESNLSILETIIDKSIPALSQVSSEALTSEATESNDSDLKDTDSISIMAENEKVTSADNQSNEEEDFEEPNLDTYFEQPEKSKSVIEQLLGEVSVRREIDPQEGNKPPINPVSEENILNLEDELESSPLPENQDDFKDLTPIKETPQFGKEVLFEISNKTEKEMDALMNKVLPIEEEEEIIEEKQDEINSVEEIKKEDSVNSPGAFSPIPKTSFQSYLDQFQPPEGVIEDLEKEDEIENVIEEVMDEVKEEEQNDLGLISIRKKKSKKKNKKLLSKIKMKKKKKKEKSEKGGKKKKKKEKNSKKASVVAEANKSIKQSDDILSETLAELLGKQGSRKKAIQMYKRLSLIFPKKSSFFAKKIAKLKK